MSIQIKVIRPGNPFPDRVVKSIFLAGPSPRGDTSGSWRKRAIQELESLGYEGHIFNPEPAEEVSSYIGQIEWEDEALNRADCIAFWVPRDMTGKLPLPGLTTNDEWGRWKESGKVVFGAPCNADKVKYQEYYARKLGVPKAETLRGTMQSAMKMVGDGDERYGGEASVPLHVWRQPEFQDWLQSQKSVGNRLDEAKVLWTFPKGSKSPFLYAVHANVYIKSEARNKTNEIFLARPDMSAVVLYRRDKVVLVREFRSPVRNARGFVYELPGGSSTKLGPLETAVTEIKEEVGLEIEPSRLKPIAKRQALATLSIHSYHVYSCELTSEELVKLEADKSVHGLEQDSERTYIEVLKVQDILEQQLVDWATLGMILQSV